MMADEYDDDVFVVENGTITNQNVPLILEHDLENIDGFEPLNEILDFDAHNQVIEENAEEENDQDLLQVELEELQDVANNPENGFHTSVSSSLSAAPSSSAVFDQNEILDTSSRTPSVAAACYTNEGYQTDLSELSEFTASVEIHPEMLTASFQQSSLNKVTITDIPTSALASRIQAAYTRHHVIQELDASNTTTSLIPPASTRSFDDNSERFQPNPPNSPAGFRGPLLKPDNSRHFPRNNRVLENPRVPQSNLSDNPYKLFVKFGSFLLMLVFLFLLAIIACLQGLLPNGFLTVFVVLLILSLAGAICCFLKACIQGDEQTSERPISRSSYGSTDMTKSGSTDST